MAVSDWMAQFCAQYSLSRSTFYLAVTYFDKCIHMLQLLPTYNKGQLKIEDLSAVCLMLAAKFEEPKLPRYRDLASCVSPNGYDTQILFNLEREIIQHVF